MRHQKQIAFQLLVVSAGTGRLHSVALPSTNLSIIPVDRVSSGMNGSAAICRCISLFVKARGHRCAGDFYLYVKRADAFSFLQCSDRNARGVQGDEAIVHVLRAGDQLRQAIGGTMPSGGPAGPLLQRVQSWNRTGPSAE